MATLPSGSPEGTGGEGSPRQKQVTSPGLALDDLDGDSSNAYRDGQNGFVTNNKSALHGGVRGTILPEWLRRGGLQEPSRLDSGRGRVVRIQLVYTNQSTKSVGVLTQPGLELHVAADTDGLRKRLNELHKAHPSDFPLPPAEDTPEGPPVLPDHWSIGDFLGGLNQVDEAAASEAQGAWSEVLAFYRSPRRADSVSFPWADTGHASDWGIYLHAGGVEKRAREIYRPIGFDNAESLSLATQDLLNHELQHAALDITALRLEAATGPSPELGHHGCPTCLPEEALCNAAVARAAAKRADEAKKQGDQRHSWAFARLQKWLTASPPGYREWATATSEEARDRFRTEVLGHDGVSPLIGLDLYNATESVVFIPGVPMYLILTPGSAAASSKWEYETL
jgi:hypothetical protein